MSNINKTSTLAQILSTLMPNTSSYLTICILISKKTIYLNEKYPIMSILTIKDLVFDLSRKEQLQLAMHILQNIADEELEENEWLTDEIEAELLRRKEAALKTFNAIKLDVKNFKFNRDEANK